MDPIRTPRRHKPAANSGGNGLLLCVAAIVATIVIIWAARQPHQGGYRIAIGKPAAEQPQAGTVVRRTVYLCRDAYGRETRQDTPCRAAAAPPPAYTEPYREPRPTLPAPNPNQALPVARATPAETVGAAAIANNNPPAPRTSANIT